MEARRLAVFELGNEVEQALVMRLMRMGYRVERAQETLEIRDDEGTILLRGHPDGIISKPIWQDRRWLFDAKSMADPIYKQMPNEAKAAGRWMRDCGFAWVEKYPGQLMAYMYAYRQEGTVLSGALVIAMNKQTGEMKTAYLPYNKEGVLALLNKCKRINAAVQFKKPPVGCNKPSTCQWCDFREVSCFPEVQIKSEGLVDPADEGNKALFDAARRYLSLEQHKEPYNRAKRAQEEVKEMFRSMKDGVYHLPDVGNVRVKRSSNGAMRLTIEPIEEGTEQ
jgi:hypothetical protein